MSLAISPITNIPIISFSADSRIPIETAKLARSGVSAAHKRKKAAVTVNVTAALEATITLAD